MNGRGSAISADDTVYVYDYKTGTVSNSEKLTKTVGAHSSPTAEALAIAPAPPKAS